MVTRLHVDTAMTELSTEMFRGRGEMFVISVRRPEAGMHVKPGVKQMVMKGNTVFASGQQQHSRGETCVGMV